MSDDRFDTDDLDELDADTAVTLEPFVSIVVSAVVSGCSLHELYAIAERFAPRLSATFPGAAEDAEGRFAVARMLARSIADMTPQPDARFALRKRARPGRNEPCDCGSGRKYKHCCQPFEQRNPFDQFNLLPYVLDALPRKRWSELAGSAVDVHAVEHAARGMLDDGDSDLVVALLEPWFKGDAPIPAAHESMLDLLLDAYGQLGRPRKKTRLMDAALARGDRAIRSSMLQRRATMAADEGDFAGAWNCFREAQREHADSASLAHLETTLLLAEGRPGQARERARFWIARLQRADAVGHAPLIELLRDLAEHGEQAMFDVQAREWPEPGQLQALLKAAPAPAVRHTLYGGNDEDCGALRPDRALARDLKAWAQAFPQVGPALTSLWVEDHPAWEDPQRWLQCLGDHPALWQSFDVLDDLVLALSAADNMIGLRLLRQELLERGETLLRLTLADHAGKTLEWPHMENRPALRLLAQRIHDCGPDPDADAIARMEWMLALNPGDNHGYREELVALHLRHHQPERALSLAERYPEDCNLGLVRVLALFALQRHDEALRVLRDVHPRLPKLAPMLAAARPRKPALSHGFITYGGDDQAWYHRERYRPLWQQYPGALDWLRKALKTLA